MTTTLLRRPVPEHTSGYLASPAPTMKSVRLRKWRHAVLPLMVALLAAYVVLHSPARGPIAAALRTETHGCYFCADSWLPFIDPLAALVLLTMSVVAALAASQLFEGTADERVLVFGVVALMLVSVPAAAIGTIGDYLALPLLRPPLGPLLSSIPAAAFLTLAATHGWRLRAPRIKFWRPHPLGAAIGLSAAAVVLLGVGISLSHPPSEIDSLGYHAPLGIFLWRDGNLGAFLDRAPGVWPLAHPGSAELWSGLLRVIGGEGLADLGQLPFALLGAAAVGSFCRRLGLRQGAAYMAGSAFVLAPMVVLQVGAQPNDVVGAALLMATAALSSAPAQSWNSQRVLVIGAGLGLVATTKLALLPSAAGIMIFVAGAILFAVYGRSTARASGFRPAVLRLLIFTVAFLVIVAPWWTRDVVRFGNPLYPAALPVLGRGFQINQQQLADAAFVPTPLAWPVYPLLEPYDEQSGMGALFAIAAITGVAVAIALRHRVRRQPLLLYGVLWMCTLPAWWLLTQHFPRFLLGVLGLGFAFVPCVLLSVPRPARKWGALVLGMAAVVSALLTIDQGLLPLASQPIDRSAFYDQVWGVDPVAADLPESEGLLLNTGYAPPTVPEYAAYYPLLGRTQSRLVVPVEGEPSTDALVSQMQAMHIRYAYVLAAPDNRAEVEAKYDSRQFELVHASAIVPGEPSGARRHLYRPATPAEQSVATMRFVFRLR